MPIQVALSAIQKLPFDFEKEVAVFIAAKKAHQNTEGVPAPAAVHRLVERAVRRVPGSITPPTADDFVADYEIVNDTPPPPPPQTLEQRKAAMANALMLVAGAACDQISPPLRSRLANMENMRALGVPEAKRTAADKAVIAAAEQRATRMDAILYHLARMEAQIHDLTANNIEGWKPEPFPK